MSYGLIACLTCFTLFCFEDVIFLPISGLMGINIDKSMDRNVCPWFSGPSFFEVLNAIEVPPRDPNGPFR